MGQATTGFAEEDSMSKIMHFSKWVGVPGSEKEAAHGAMSGALTPAHESFDVSLVLRRRKSLPELAHWQHQRMTHAEYAANHGADPVDIQKAEAFARHFKLNVQAVLAVERTVLLQGTAADFSMAFGVELRTHRLQSGQTYRGRVGKISIPDELEGVVVGVFGLDNRRVAWPQVRFHSRSKLAMASRAPEYQTPGPITSFYSSELAKSYNFPTDVDGTGQTIGLVELGGGFRQKDLDTYFKQAGVSNPPTVTVGKVTGGATNAPDPEAQDQPDIEVLLDIEVAGAVAPGANLVVYFVKGGSEQQCLRGVTSAVHDAASNVSVLLLSWGGPEFERGGGLFGRTQKQFQDNMNDVLQSAAHLGITVCVSSGDNASACMPLNDPDRPWDGQAHVSFPASSPFVLACGGTHVIDAAAARLKEETWHPEANVGTGGGISRYFQLPSYQQSFVSQSAVNPVGGTGRGVPDVAADAAQESGIRVLVDGMTFPDPAQNLPPIGGTSASAALWAGLIALLNQSLKTRLGFVNPLFYQLPPASGAFHDVTAGSNGDYRTRSGWDACTGLGTPNGQILAAALKAILSKKNPHV
jgi:kumamolisin